MLQAQIIFTIKVLEYRVVVCLIRSELFKQIKNYKNLFRFEANWHQLIFLGKPCIVNVTFLFLNHESIILKINVNIL